MADNKKYYYLKIKENFYDSEEMIILQGMQDGYLYSDILMKLYLRSLKNNGKLMFKDVIPYTSDILAAVVRHQVGTVEKALKLFRDLGLIEILDNGAIYMMDIQNFIGESSTEADRKRLYRAKIEDEKVNKAPSFPENGQMSGQMSGHCPDKTTPEIEIEIEIEKELDLEIEIEKDKKDSNESSSHPSPIEEVLYLYNEICKSLPSVRSFTDKRKKAVNKLLEESNIEEIKEGFKKAENSQFLKGENDRGWKADFDFIINYNNIIKILEGKYNNKSSNQSKQQDKYRVDRNYGYDWEAEDKRALEEEMKRIEMQKRAEEHYEHK